MGRRAGILPKMDFTLCLAGFANSTGSEVYGTIPINFSLTLKPLVTICALYRYFEALQHALRLRNNKNSPAENKKHSKSLLKEDSNLALLRIVECFLEAAPQQVLQIAILLSEKREQSGKTQNVNLWQSKLLFVTRFTIILTISKYADNYLISLLAVYLYWSVVTSLMSTAWTFAMYHRSVRFVQKDKMRISWTGSLIQFGWIFFVTSSYNMPLKRFNRNKPWEVTV